MSTRWDTFCFFGTKNYEHGPLFPDQEVQQTDTEQNKHDVTLTMPNGESFSVTVSHNCTMLDLKTAVCKHKGYSPGDQNFLLEGGGMLLNDHLKLLDLTNSSPDLFLIIEATDGE